jgi:hypothetical protein
LRLPAFRLLLPERVDLLLLSQFTTNEIAGENVN